MEADIPNGVASHVRGIRPITMHWIAGQSEHTMLFRTMSFLKIDVFQKGGAERSNNNVWTYALRRVRDAFRENRTVEDPKVVEELVKRARDGLALIQRQASLSQCMRGLGEDIDCVYDHDFHPLVFEIQY
ncbi:hypothetical protein cypCar_00027834 [Cyprinus carpio]|nr:hypothetical protein cypCar_00027834 [Cyprinus carpio]